MSLDLSSLEKALSSLEISIDVYFQFEQKQKNENTENILNVLKAGVFQKFKITYEQCWKFMKRWIEENDSPNIVDGVTRRELFRISAENKLILDVETWMSFHKSRNLTSHTYDKKNAEESFNISVAFLKEASNFLTRIKSHND